MTTTVLNCATGTLAPYTGSSEMPWNRQRASHLFRRLGFGVPLATLDNALNQNPAVFINSYIDATINAPLSPEPEWAYMEYSAYNDYPTERQAQIVEWLTTWFTDFIENPLRGKLSLFWSNHFVTELNVYDCPSWLYQYHKVLEEYQFGNFKDFVREIGITPAMLIYLNGYESTNDSPNENYARELYELFTLGADNGYTQEDIEETARALTGWNQFSDYCGSISFFPLTFDNQSKTIFGQTSNFNYDGVIDNLFEQRAPQIATFICGKLYKHFIHPEPNEDIIAELAQTFLDNDFELAPVYHQLFKSEHFFDEEVMNVVVKSPLESVLFMPHEMGLSITEGTKYTLIEYASYIGQTLSDPPNVAGWQGNRTWISTGLLTARWNIAAYFAFTTFENFPDYLTDLALQIVEDTDLNDPAVITEMIVDYFIPGGLTDSTQYERATIVFKADIPENYFDEGWWNLGWDSVPAQVALLLVYIGKMPEYQLM